MLVNEKKFSSECIKDHFSWLTDSGGYFTLHQILLDLSISLWEWFNMKITSLISYTKHIHVPKFKHYRSKLPFVRTFS